MSRTWMAAIMSAGLFLSAAGDDFEDFIQASAKVAANYNHGVQTKGTRFDKEYQMNLEHQKQLGSKVQQVIRRLGIGQDIDFPLMTYELEQIYLGTQTKTGIKGSAKLHAHSDSPEALLKILTEDVKALRKMEFTTADGGSIKSSLETRRRLLEFKRLVNFFRQNYARIYKNPQKKDVSLDRIFQGRMIRMSALAAILMQIAGRNYPDTLSRNNLQTETAALMKHYEAWCDLRMKTASRSRGRGRSRSSRTAVKRIDGLNTIAARQSEINMSLRNINDQLAQWEQAGFQSDKPIAKGGEKSAAESDPAEVMRKEEKTKNYAAMKTGELSGLLAKRRQQILRSNRSMDGFDRNAERRYLLTLPRDCKRSYNEFLREFQQQGYSSGQAVRSAILKIHTKIQMEGKTPPAKELIRILNALDQDEERRRERNEVDFKLERGKIESN